MALSCSAEALGHNSLKCRCIVQWDMRTKNRLPYYMVIHQTLRILQTNIFPLCKYILSEKEFNSTPESGTDEDRVGSWMTLTFLADLDCFSHIVSSVSKANSLAPFPSSTVSSQGLCSASIFTQLSFQCFRFFCIFVFCIVHPLSKCLKQQWNTEKQFLSDKQKKVKSKSEFPNVWSFHSDVPSLRTAQKDTHAVIEAQKFTHAQKGLTFREWIFHCTVANFSK